MRPTRESVRVRMKRPRYSKRPDPVKLLVVYVAIVPLRPLCSCVSSSSPESSSCETGTSEVAFAAGWSASSLPPDELLVP